MKKTIIVMALMLLLAASYAYAVPTGASGLDEGATSTRSDFSGIAPTSVTADGGNITALDVEGIRQTGYWQGFYGNITGEIVLDDANNKTFYNWSLTAATGEIYASTDNAVTWGSIACASQTNIQAEHTALGMAFEDGDNVNNTYTGTHDITVSGSTLSSCPSTNTWVNDAPSTTEFYQSLLYEGSAIVYATELEPDQQSFNGGTADFQLLVGDQEGATTTTYYFYVELD